MQKGFRHSKESKERMRLAALKRDNSKRIASLPRGAAHWSWSKKPTKLTVHKRLHRTVGKASLFPCVDCKKKAFDWSNETGRYSDDPKDYRPRCRSCHIKKDKNWIKRT